MKKRTKKNIESKVGSNPAANVSLDPEKGYGITDTEEKKKDSE